MLDISREHSPPEKGLANLRANDQKSSRKSSPSLGVHGPLPTPDRCSLAPTCASSGGDSSINPGVLTCGENFLAGVLCQVEPLLPHPRRERSLARIQNTHVHFSDEVS